MRTLLVAALVAGACLAGSAPLHAQDDPKAVLEKAVKAMGGLDKLSKYPASRMKTTGSMDIMGANAPFTGEFIYQLPGQFKMDMTMEIMGQKIQILQVLNGDKAWLKVMGMDMELSGEQLDNLKEESYANLVEAIAPLLADKNKKFTLSLVGEQKVHDKPAIGVKVVCTGHKDINLYFDKESGLLAKSERRSKDFNGTEVAHESLFSDYKEVEGVKLSFKYRVNHDGKKFLEGEITEAKLLEKLDASEFAKP